MSLDKSRESDILKTQMDFADLSAQEQAEFSTVTGIEDDCAIEHHKGFCVKEFEERLQGLTRENFNLKLRISLLEDKKNTNIPVGAEALYKQNIDLKVETESLIQDLQQKQDLLCEASKALELLDKEKASDHQRSQMIIDELNQKIEALNSEVSSLQSALATKSESNQPNDTGYADLLGSVDLKDIEHQKLLKELNDAQANFDKQMASMNQTIQNLKSEKKDIESKASKLHYENSSMKDKLASFMKSKNDESQSKSLEAELKEYKEKWASTQCDLQDMEEKYKEAERERVKTLKLLKSTILDLESERSKNCATQGDQKAMNHNRSLNEYQNVLTQKNNEIAKIQSELSEAKRNLQQMTCQELQDKTREIEKLSSLVKSLQSGRNNNSLADPTRFSLEKLSESFNDLKFQKVMHEKKESQRKIDELMIKLGEVAQTQTKQHVEELQQQMAIVVEKQEVTDTTLAKCAELCGVTLDHLHELARFLSALLQQKEIRESLSEMTVCNIQSAIDKTFELSNNHAGRYSLEERLSSLLNVSALDHLMNAARQSISNIRDIQRANKSLQVSCNENIEFELLAAKNDLEDVSRVNQVLEDEIINLKELVKKQQSELSQYEEMMEQNKETKRLLDLDLTAAQNYVNVLQKETEDRLEKTQKTIDELNERCSELVEVLKAETVHRISCEDKAVASEKLALKLTKELEEHKRDLTENWITMEEHKTALQMCQSAFIEAKAAHETTSAELEKLLRIKNETELNAVSNAQDTTSTLRKIEISEDRKRMLSSIGETADTSSSEPACGDCPKYQAKIKELKHYLGRALEKIKMQDERKAHNEHVIQSQLSKTETFLSKARSNMESILKVRDENQKPE